jgi:O-antigen/teichoic acid export membrane protein
MFHGFSVSVSLRIARLLISLVLTSYLARYLGQSGFGQLMVSMSVVAILLCVTELGLIGISVREFVKIRGEEEAVTMGSAVHSRLAVGALFYAALLIYVLLAKPAHGMLLVIYGSLLMTHAVTEVACWLDAHHFQKDTAKGQFTSFVISSLFVVGGLICQAPLWFFAATYVFDCWLCALLWLRLYWRQGGRTTSWKWSWQRTRKLLKESWFEMLSTLALLLLFRMDTIMVEALRSEQEAGVYGAAARVSEVLYFIPSILASICLPALVALKAEQPERYETRFADYFAVTLILATLGSVMLVVIAPHVISILFGEAFAESAPILAVHAWSFIPYALGMTRTQYFTAEGRLWLNLPCVLLALGTNLLLNWLWIPQHGGLGAAWATLIAYTLGWVVTSFIFPAAWDVNRMHWRGLRQLPAGLLDLWSQVTRRLHPKVN